MTYKNVNIYLLDKINYKKDIKQIEKEIRFLFPSLLNFNFDKLFFSRITIYDYILTFQKYKIKVRCDEKFRIMFIKHYKNKVARLLTDLKS